MPAPARIAVLMTCFNRRDLTVACLERLAREPLFDPSGLFLVDDGSSDGTGDAVRALLPAANVIRGDGSLFWNGGMRLAWDSARASGRPFDFYLWLNDDVVLEEGTLAMLVEDADACVRRGEAVIVSAAVREPGAQTITYGAQVRPDPSGKPLRMMLLAPEGRPIPADTVSGNVVLVSAAAEARLGNLIPDFEHIYGDLDYGLRAGKAGVPMFLASRVGGTCAANSVSGSSHDETLGLAARLKKRWAEDRKVHARDWRRFVALHDSRPLAGLRHRVAPYLRLLVQRPNRYGTTVANQTDT